MKLSKETVKFLSKFSGTSLNNEIKHSGFVLEDSLGHSSIFIKWKGNFKSVYYSVDWDELETSLKDSALTSKTILSMAYVMDYSVEVFDSFPKLYRLVTMKKLTSN